MTKVRALVGVLAVIVLVAFAAGCGQGSHQVQKDVKKKVEAKGQQIQKEAKKVEAKGQQAKKKVKK